METKALQIREERPTDFLMKCIQSKDKMAIAVLEGSLTVDMAIASPNVSALVATHGERNVLSAAMDIILATSAYFNTNGNINPDQAMQIASLFVSEYKLESLEDLMLCMKKLKLGVYGKVYRMDGEVIFNCFNQYLDEKYARFEQIKKAERMEIANHVDEEYIFFAGKVLEEKGKVREVEPVKEKRKTDKSHFDDLKNITASNRFSLKELQDMEAYYKSINVPVSGLIEHGQPITAGHFDHYIELIQGYIKLHKEK